VSTTQVLDEGNTTYVLPQQTRCNFKKLEQQGKK